jgi:hypothetical protein
MMKGHRLPEIRWNGEPAFVASLAIGGMDGHQQTFLGIGAMCRFLP